MYKLNLDCIVYTSLVEGPHTREWSGGRQRNAEVGGEGRVPLCGARLFKQEEHLPGFRAYTSVLQECVHELHCIQVTSIILLSYT